MHRKKNVKSSHGSSSLTISTAEIEEVIEQLKMQKYRSSTRKNYYCVWKTFNLFYIQLDKKPNNWEDRIILFTAYLINQIENPPQ